MSGVLLWTLAAALGGGLILASTQLFWGSAVVMGRVLWCTLAGTAVSVAYLMGLGAMGADDEGVVAGSIVLIGVAAGLVMKGKREVSRNDVGAEQA